ncbi:MAG TPA: alpha/beta hydrolase-fold protein [Acidimicrobiales bacterium]|jgi:enterochelin esterase-like enzyme|nr:alpha/beta hydrolase-fold protein [Acidimicrobiales bacterium]
MELVINFSIITGWFPVVVITVALVSLLVTVGWRDGAWKAQLVFGLPAAFLLTILLALSIHFFQFVPDDFPRTFYLWAWLVIFALVSAILGWPKGGWVLRPLSIIAILFCFLAAATVINQQFGYYPTLDRALGKDAANFTSLPALQAIRDQVRDTGKLPDHGDTINVTIPPTLSKFQAAQAEVYLPPAWFHNPEPALPVIVLIAGYPGMPSDWTRAAFADTTANEFAALHGGTAPIIVMPDANGTAQDSECVNSKLGNAETYLTVDLPAYMRTEFNANTGAHSFAVAGLSAGGTCAEVLALRNPKIFPDFATYSGYAILTYETSDTQVTINTLFNGSVAEYNKFDPTILLTNNKFPGTSAWFEAGLQDPQLPTAISLHTLATKAGLSQACLLTPTGGHDFPFWTRAFKDSLPWLSWKLGLTPAPTGSPAKCTPPIH